MRKRRVFLTAAAVFCSIGLISSDILANADPQNHWPRRPRHPRRPYIYTD